MLTEKKKRVLRFLATTQNQGHSINQIARKCSLSPNGAYKILKSLENEEIVAWKSVANSKVYSINHRNDKTAQVLALAFLPAALPGRVRMRADDLNPLRKIAPVCILFGSYITGKANPNDLDALFVLKKEKFGAYKEALKRAQEIIPVGIHDTVQTREDLQQNIQMGTPAVTEALRNGIVLWGVQELMRIICNVKR